MTCDDDQGHVLMAGDKSLYSKHNEINAGVCLLCLLCQSWFITNFYELLKSESYPRNTGVDREDLGQNDILPTFWENSMFPRNLRWFNNFRKDADFSRNEIRPGFLIVSNRSKEFFPVIREKRSSQKETMRAKIAIVSSAVVERLDKQNSLVNHWRQFLY